MLFYGLTSGHLGFMQITRVTQSYRLGSQVEFAVGHDEYKSAKMFTGENSDKLIIERVTVKLTSF